MGNNSVTHTIYLDCWLQVNGKNSLSNTIKGNSCPVYERYYNEQMARRQISTMDFLYLYG